MTIQEKFEKFHEENPQVYSRLVALALRIKRESGKDHGSISMLFEVLRYQGLTNVKTSDVEDVKLCNSFRSRYARLIMDGVHELRGFFKTKELRSK